MRDLLDSVGVCSLIGINFTTYVGLIIVVVGAFLEIVGYLASKPWKSSSGKDS
jgi:hypothetical protein